MANAKIDVKIGPVSFAGEAEEKWLAAQLDKLLQQAPALLASTTDQDREDKGDGGGDQTEKKRAPKGDPGTLAKFIESKGVGGNQTKRFLATAEWLHLKGSERLTTGDVAKALTNSHQSKLNNPSDCLGKNVKQGHCEKDGKKFYVTPEGRKSLG